MKTTACCRAVRAHAFALCLCVCLCLWAVLAGTARAQDRTELERTAIVGNRELPKVLYIVPWKKPAAAPLTARLGGGVLDDLPTALDRDVLRRQLRLDASLQARSAATANATPTGDKP